MTPQFTLKKTEVTPSIFFGTLFQIRDIAHLTHLRQHNKSGWEHSALNTLYDEILELTDGLVESYQGIYNLLEITIPETSSRKDSIAWLSEIYLYISKNRGIFSESWIQNEIDTICKLIAQTLYRLKYVN